MLIQIVLRELKLNLPLFKLKWRPTSKLSKTKEKNKQKVSKCKEIDQKINSKA